MTSFNYFFTPVGLGIHIVIGIVIGAILGIIVQKWKKDSISIMDLGLGK